MSPFLSGMQKSITIGLLVGLSVLVGALIAIAFSLAHTLNELDATLDASRKLINETQTSVKAVREHVDRDLTEIGLTAASLRKTALEAEKASAEQRKYWADSSAEVRQTIASLNQAIQHTDDAINQKVLPAAVSAIQDTHQIAAAAAQSIEEVNHELKPVLANAAALSASGAAVLADPAIRDSLQQIDATITNLNHATQHVDETTLVLENYARRITKPGSVLWQGLLAVGHAISAFGPAIGKLF